MKVKYQKAYDLVKYDVSYYKMDMIDFVHYKRT